MVLEKTKKPSLKSAYLTRTDGIIDRSWFFLLLTRNKYHKNITSERAKAEKIKV
ncbi:hypothetical protein FTV88_2949 [Heliorestis convoluta]|uniref:Uncharacterized protein n=1 Tax=Heliorestis convoluta TaxID=356322 RepID=A0A5Q2N213_9FIRM|nr:hypothetical protein FTV88_2949 [Heliorestis convoluta]